MTDIALRLHTRGFIVPLALREIQVLRILGRLGMVPGQTLHDLLGVGTTPRSTRRMLRHLTERKLIWCGHMPHAQASGRLRGRTPNAYGLTDDGKQMLDIFAAEPHDGTLERLISRSKQAPAPPTAAQIMLDTYSSDWCASLLDQLRRIPLFVGVQMQRRYAITATDGALRQTIGTAITLAFDPNQKTFNRTPQEIPWLSQGAISSTWKLVRLGVEIDTGITPLRVLFELAQTYTALTNDGTHQRVLGGPVRPVIITPPGNRARAVADVWMAASPGSSALLSSVERTNHATYGVLWGTTSASNRHPFRKRPSWDRCWEPSNSGPR